MKGVFHGGRISVQAAKVPGAAIGTSATRSQAIGVATIALASLSCLLACSMRGDQALAAPMLGAVVPAGAAAAIPLGIYDEVDGPACSLSADGLVWYRRPGGLGVPVEASFARCSTSAVVRSVASPPLPAWSKPRRGHVNHAIFVAASLQEAFSPAGMLALHSVASSERIPITWMIASWAWVDRAKLHQAFHERFGDDVQTAVGIAARERQILPWLKPVIAVDGAGRERSVADLQAHGFLGFWGIAWNSHGTDRNADLGAPWGVYCADPGSYKHPDPKPGCRMLVFEWTARDLTRAYLSEQEAAFSTDPDDLRERGGFTVDGARRYIRSLTDAYAAAGEERPIVMIAQQESAEEAFDDRTGDREILKALYHQARIDGMHPATLSEAAFAARAFAAQPEAIAFPYVPGGRVYQTLNCDVSPGTIDFHDSRTGLTFVAGKTMPVRAFLYDRAEPSRFNVPVSALPASAFPALTAVRRVPGGLAFRFHASAPMHFGVALWSDPEAIGLPAQPGVVRAGRAGAVVVVDLPAGDSTARIRCTKCDPSGLPLAP